MDRWSTYYKSLASIAFNQGYEVYVTHPDSEEVKLRSIKELEEADVHMFIIKRKLT